MLENNVKMGYKTMTYDPDRNMVVSIASPDMAYSATVGTVIRMPGNGLYLSGDKQLVIDYYTEMTDGPEVIVTFEFKGDDVVTGTADGSGEYTVRSATITQIEPV